MEYSAYLHDAPCKPPGHRHAGISGRSFLSRERKTITGVDIHQGRLRAPQSQHLAIRCKFSELRDTELSDAVESSLAFLETFGNKAVPIKRLRGGHAE